MRRTTRTLNRRLALPGVLLTLGLVGACGDGELVAPPQADDVPQFVPVPVFSVSGVEAIRVAGNPTCAVLNLDDVNFPTITSDFEFKIDANPGLIGPGGETYTLTSGTQHSHQTQLQGGAPSDNINTVTILNSDGVYFDWSATLGIDAVIVKAGTNGDSYVYSPEAFEDARLLSPDSKDISHISFCYDYELTAEKTAAAEYTSTYTWDITKTVDESSHVGFLGNPFLSTYTVSVDQMITESDHKVVGDITVSNPTPFEVTFSISDLVDGTEAIVTCAEGNTLAAGATTTCTYEAGLDGQIDGTNTATVTSDNVDVDGAEASAGYAFGEPTTIVGSTAINVTDTYPGSTVGAASGDFQWTYPRLFACPVDESMYTDGVYTAEFPNTATITETEQSDDANVSMACYNIEVSKTADTEWRKKYDWTITKDVDVAAHAGSPGDMFTSSYSVVVDQTITDYGYKALGIISVTNPAPTAITVDVADQMNGTAAAVVCGSGGASLTVDGESTGVCLYTIDLADNSTQTNVATVTFMGRDLEATAEVLFGEPIIEGSPDINVTDSYAGSTVGAASGDMSWTYDRSFTCSSEASAYASGAYSESFPNTAAIVEDGQSDDANVDLTCTPADLTATKTADAGYDERHTWDVTKSVDPASQGGYPGDELAWNWTVGVTESFVEENFAVTGDITVANDNPFAVDFTVSDVLGDGTEAAVSCPATVPGDASVTCTYTAAPTGRTASINTATVASGTAGIGGAVATASVDFMSNVINGTATLTDVQGPLDESLTAGSGPWTFPYGDSHVCSSNAADYGAGGSYTATLNNTAVIASDGQSNEASASTTYTCEAYFVDVTKTTNGVVDPNRSWSFSLFEGPDGFGGTQVGSSSSTNGDADGILDFGAPVPALRLDQGYTVCEVAVPAGWSTTWATGGTTLIPYNPNSDNVPAEDLGNRCFDFGAGTSYLVAAGETLMFAVDNAFPGGDPRTPGYWKNWNTCTRGNQVRTATKNGGVDEGWYIMDDILNDPGVAWGDFVIASCEDGVSILDQRDRDSGRKRASDAAYTLAMHLLAAQLNFSAGASSCQIAQDAAIAGEQLLVGLGFDGTGRYLRPRNALYDDALAIAATLDEYNNGLVCN